MNNNIKWLLIENINKLLLTYNYLSESYEDCWNIEISSTNDKNELIRLEALTSRFERFVDIFLSKFLKSLSLYETWLDDGTIRDKLLFTEKLECIRNSDNWISMRNLRNMIAHDYLYMENIRMFDYVNKYMKNEIKNTMKWIEKYKEKIEK